MHLLLNDHLEAIDLAATLAQLPAWRLRQALAFRHEHQQLQNAVAYLLLCKALREGYGIEEQPAFDYGQKGKPFLKDHPDVHFNLSHCSEAVICVTDDGPIGVDIESVKAFDEEVARYAMNADELQQILQAPRPDVAFTRLWTRKEAVLKCSGQGLIDQAGLHNLLRSNSHRLVTVESPDLRYVYSVCSNVQLTINN